MPTSAKIDVPYFKSDERPYHCSEASAQMVHKFFCEQSRVTQGGIERRGGRTFDGNLEVGDKGLEWFFKQLGYRVTMIDQPTMNQLKRAFNKRSEPIILRLQWANGGRHTVVMTGYDDNVIIAHDPDSGPDKSFTFNDTSYSIIRAMVIRDPGQCVMF